MTPRPTRASIRPAGLLALAAVSALGPVACGSAHRASTSGATVAPEPLPTMSTSATTSPPTTVKPVSHRAVAVVAPLTGLPATRTAARRPAVVVKIDNLQAALPQTGTNQADVVYEEMVEGGLTRLAAVFQSDYAPTVGPVRSGRLTDEGIADDLGHPVLAYAGANALFQPQLLAQPLSAIDDDIAPNLFVRDYSRAAPHNLFASIAGLAATDTRHAPPAPLWGFRRPGSRFAGAGVRPAAAVALTFPAATLRWTWDAKTRLWLRTQNASADLDSSGRQLSAGNVIIQWIPYITSAYVSGEGAGANGGPIPEGVMVGHGMAWYLSGGAVVKGTWSRASLTSRTTYRDTAGRPIRLQPGRTWVELPMVGAAATLTP